MQTVTSRADALRFGRYWRDGGAILLIALITALFFRPVLFGGAWLPHGGGDNVSFLYPMYRFIAAGISNGEIPLWNPHQYAGFPLIADNQNGMFYPINWLLFVLWPTFSYAALEGLVVGHIFLAGVGMYACARGWRDRDRIRPIPALIAAVAFMLSDLFVTHVGNYNLIAVIAWLPLIFLSFHRAVTPSFHHRVAPSLAWSLACGVLIGISTLAGHGQMTFFIAFFLGIYAVYCILIDRTWHPLAWLAVAGLIGVGLAAVNVLPAVVLRSETVRGTFSYAQSVNYSLPWLGLTGIAAPDFFGRGALSFWGDWSRVEVGYLGVMPWLLALIAVLRYRTRHNLFFVVAALFFLLLALGSNTATHWLIFEPLALPFQVPARFIVLVNFCVALLAAIGANGLTTAVMQRSRRWDWVLAGGVLVGMVLGLVWLMGQVDGPAKQMQQAVVGFAVAATLGWGLVWLRLIGWLPALLFGWLALGLVSAELIANGQSVEIDRNDPTTGYQNESATTFLQANAALNRIDAATGAWQPSAAQLHGLYAIGGVFNPLALSDYDVYMQSLGYRGSPPYNLLGVKYIVADKTEPPGDTAFLVPVFADDPNVDIYLNTRALPRVMMVYRATVLADDQAVFDAIHAPDFAPDQVIYLTDGAALEQEPAAHRIEVVGYWLNEVRIDVQTDAPGYLLLSDMYYPHWQATVNGESAEILKANTAFRAIFLEAGQHTVAMQFRPPAWPIAIIISLVTLIAVVIVISVLSRSRSAIANPKSEIQ
ncbi:MAG: YfhO family protein [Anaerolineae bacterium]|nr:YfhO family protein [Anaerolineae bacterium]